MLTLYSQPDCSSCHMVEKYLVDNQIPHTVLNIREDADALARVSALGYKTTPVVIEPDGTHWSEFRYDRLAALKAAL